MNQAPSASPPSPAALPLPPVVPVNPSVPGTAVGVPAAGLGVSGGAVPQDQGSVGMENPLLAPATRETQLAGAYAEAAAIYAAIFRGPPPGGLAQRYAAALQALPLQPNPIESSPLWGSPRRLAAVEYFLRMSRGKNGLSQRFQIVFYLAEMDPSLFSRFARAKPSWLRGVVDLGRASLAALVSLGQGFWWWRRSARV